MAVSQHEYLLKLSIRRENAMNCGCLELKWLVSMRPHRFEDRTKYRIAVRGSVTHFAVRRETHEMPVIGTQERSAFDQFTAAIGGAADLP